MKKSLFIFVCMVFIFSSSFAQGNALKMVEIPDKNIKILTTEVTKNLYAFVMGELPSSKNAEYDDICPVNYVSFYDAIYFCNKLSEMSGLKSVYAFNGKTDVNTWNYTPHQAHYLMGKVSTRRNADGYRLPTVEEWQYVANSGETYLYSGSNDIEDVAWYSKNAQKKTHPVGLKNPNQYGLYDMTGNVSEWCWSLPLYKEVSTDDLDEFIPTLGGSFKSNETACMVNKIKRTLVNFSSAEIGFRIVSKLPDSF